MRASQSWMRASEGFAPRPPRSPTEGGWRGASLRRESGPRGDVALATSTDAPAAAAAIPTTKVEVIAALTEDDGEAHGDGEEATDEGNEGKQRHDRTPLNRLVPIGS